jgi:hypothetical protein
MDMRYGTRRRILDLPDRYTLISSGLAWVPYFVTRSIVSVIRRTVMIHRANELGWSSTIEIDDKPCNGHIDEEKVGHTTPNLIIVKILTSSSTAQAQVRKSH